MVADKMRRQWLRNSSCYQRLNCIKKKQRKWFRLSSATTLCTLNICTLNIWCVWESHLIWSAASKLRSLWLICLLRLFYSIMKWTCFTDCVTPLWNEPVFSTITRVAIVLYYNNQFVCCPEPSTHTQPCPAVLVPHREHLVVWFKFLVTNTFLIWNINCRACN